MWKYLTEALSWESSFGFHIKVEVKCYLFSNTYLFLAKFFIDQVDGSFILFFPLLINLTNQSVYC